MACSGTPNDLASETKAIIKGLLISTPLTITVNKLCHDFKQMVGYDLPYRDLGHATLFDYLFSIPDTVNVLGRGKYAELQPVIGEKSQHINELVMKQRMSKMQITQAVKPRRRRSDNFNCQQPAAVVSNRRSLAIPVNRPSTRQMIPFEIQNNLHRLIVRYPNGLMCSQLGAAYAKEFGYEIGPEQYGFQNLKEMCMALRDVFRYSTAAVACSGDDVRLSQQLKSQSQLPTDEEDKCAKPPRIDWGVMMPPQNVHTFERIPRIKRPQVGSLLTCDVTEIYSPAKFFIIIKKKNVDYCFEDFQMKLQEFFADKETYRIPELLIDQRLYCVVRGGGGQYSRAVTIDLSNKSVKVLLIDYGIVESNVDLSRVYYLPKAFASLPSQAVQCRLFNVRPTPHPNSDVWTEKVVRRFQELVRHKQTIVKVMKCDECGEDDDGVAPVIDVDLMYHHVVTINNMLVDENLAVNNVQDLLLKTL